MAWQRGTALVPTVERLVQLTGAQDLRNLEATGELALEDLLVTASDAVFDRLVADGLDPRRLQNPSVYERAVAFGFLGLLAVQGDGGQDDFEKILTLADRFYRQVRPLLLEGDAPRTAGEGLPRVGNPQLHRRRL